MYDKIHISMREHEECAFMLKLNWWIEKTQ